jgi:hypothetical protein
VIKFPSGANPKLAGRSPQFDPFSGNSRFPRDTTIAFATAVGIDRETTAG